MFRNHLFISVLIILGMVALSPAQSPDFTGLKVMINPGHGGHDSNDRGMPNGFWESEGNLTKGLWLRDLLEARGCEVVMSRVENRTEDDLALSVIAAIANQNHVNLFLSIHSNAGNQSVNYPIAFFHGETANPSDPNAKRFAQDLWEQLVSNEATWWSSTDQKVLGDYVIYPGSGFGVLRGLKDVTGVLSEGSFHDYRPEMDRLLNLDYRKQEAWNMLYAITTYFGLEGSENHGHISGIIRDSLLTKENYTIAGSADKYHNVNGALVELMETGELYLVDTLNTGFYMFDSIVPGNYHLVFSAHDYFNDTVEVEVAAHRFSYINHWLEADKTMAPKMISYSPGDSALTACYEPVTLTFNMNMDSATVAEAFSIDPDIPGSFSWDKEYLTLAFQPHLPYDTGTVYTIKLDSTAEHQWGVNMDTIHSFSFITDDRNRFRLDTSFPDSGLQEVSPFLQFRLIFDAPLKNSSLINAITIISEDGTSLSTKGASIFTLDGKGHYYFSPETGLDYNENYTLVLSGSIQDEGNIPMVDTQRIDFSTMEDPGVITILDEFEDPDLWEIDFDQSQGIDEQSFLYLWKKTYLSGKASMLFRYTSLSSHASCIIRAIDSIQVDNRLPDAGMWIWGDLSQHQVYLGFDNGVEKELCQIDFAGWSYHITQVPGEATRLTHIKVVMAEEGQTGDLYFDAFHQPGSTVSVQHAVTSGPGISIFPNPVTGSSIHIEGIKDKAFSYSVYSVSGALLQEGIHWGGGILGLSESTLKHNLVILKIISESASYSRVLEIVK